MIPNANEPLDSQHFPEYIRRQFESWIQGENDRNTCLHDTCQSCKGTGRDELGRACIHHLSCPCRRCTPTTFMQ